MSLLYKTTATFADMPHPAMDTAMELWPKKAAPSPLVPKKLNFYCTLGLRGELREQRPAAELTNYFGDNQILMGRMNGCNSIMKNNTYEIKNFEFGYKISKNGGVFSKNFERFRSFFKLFRMDFESNNENAPKVSSYAENIQVWESIRYIPGFAKLSYTGISVLIYLRLSHSCY